MSVDPSVAPFFTVTRRDPDQSRGVVRFTDASGGYDEEKAELYWGDPLTQPTYYDAQNVNVWDRPGKCFLVSEWTRIGSAEASDREYLIYPFNVACYRFPTANFDASLVQKVTAATGAISAWTAPTNPYAGATAVRNGVEWRGVFYVASGENFLRTVSTAEAWSTLAAPGAVGAAIVGQVGVGIDDKLVVWWEGAGLYTYDGTTWAKIYPTTAGVIPSDTYCDLIFMGPGSLQFLTRNSSNVTTWREYSVEPTGTFTASWLAEPGLRVWPQGGVAHQGESWVVGRLGSHRNVGILYAKAKLQAPVPIAVLDTNYATTDQRGLDWAWRCMFTVGDVVWIGGSSRQDHNACLFRFEVDDDGEIINPGATISGLAGPIYSIGLLPYGASGADTTERIFIAAQKATYYKDSDEGSDPTTDASTGFIQWPDIDLGLEDRYKLWADISGALSEISADGHIEFQYRIDPTDPSDSWVAIEDTLEPTVFDDTTGIFNSQAPDDDESIGLTGTRLRMLQIRCVWTRPLSGTARDVLDMVSVKIAGLYDLGSDGT